MYHPRLKGSHYEMGRKMGVVFKKNNAKFPIKLDSFQRRFGEESGEVLKAYFPEAAAEIKGITDELNFNNTLFTSWMMCMGCCLDLNKIENIEVRGCTAFAFVENGNIYFGRNNDLPPSFKKICKSILYYPEGKFRFILNTSSFINGEEGINEKGLTASMTFIVPRLDEIKPGLNSLFLVRYILENCTNVNDAICAIKKIPVASSCNILMADKTGKIAVAECNPFKIIIREPEKTGKRQFAVIANHFISSEMKKHDGAPHNMFYSSERYRTAESTLSKNECTCGFELSKNLLSGKFGFMCQYPKILHFNTVWSSVYCVSLDKVFIANGNPRKAAFIEDKRSLFL